MINIHEAKTHLSKLVERAAGGEEITIAKAGRPMAKLVPYVPAKIQRTPGAWKDDLWLGPDFDETPEWLINAFEGEG